MFFTDLGLENLGAQISNNVRNALAPLDNLGARINQQVKEGLAPLDHLGDNLNKMFANIAKTVEMREGIRGTTVVTTDKGKYIIKNRVVHECGGDISDLGQCSGELRALTDANPKMKCFPNRFAIVNNYICIFNGDSSYIGINHDGIQCSGTLINYEDYKNECGNRNTYKYRFIADENDPTRNMLPVNITGCQNTVPIGVCEFY